jgi:Aldehyde dehydrogenase family
VWTRNQERGKTIARRIEAGTVMINDVVSCFGISEAPHGGVKASGIGRTHGRFGLDEMVRLKYVDSDRLPGVKKVWWYGYGEGFTRQIESFLDLQFALRLSRKLRGGLGSAGVYLRKRL